MHAHETRVVLGMNFLALDEDVLLQIFEELRPHRNLRPLSLTCKRVRRMCMGTLFRKSFIKARVLSSESAAYIQEYSLWSFVRYVTATFWS